MKYDIMKYNEREVSICPTYIGKNSYIDSLVYRVGYPNSKTPYKPEKPYVDFARVDYAILG